MWQQSDRETGLPARRHHGDLQCHIRTAKGRGHLDLWITRCWRSHSFILRWLAATSKHSQDVKLTWPKHDQDGWLTGWINDWTNGALGRLSKLRYANLAKCVFLIKKLTRDECVPCQHGGTRSHAPYSGIPTKLHFLTQIFADGGKGSAWGRQQNLSSVTKSLTHTMILRNDRSNEKWSSGPPRSKRQNIKTFLNWKRCDSGDRIHLVQDTGHRPAVVNTVTDL
jgi:hypothetical protein